jgi:hypothetical protein
MLPPSSETPANTVHSDGVALPISPELVLVSPPDLREHALAALPLRALSERPSAAPSPLPAAPSVGAAEQPFHVRRGRTARYLLSRGLLAIASFAAGVVLGAVLTRSATEPGATRGALEERATQPDLSLPPVPADPSLAAPSPGPVTAGASKRSRQPARPRASPPAATKTATVPTAPVTTTSGSTGPLRENLDLIRGSGYVMPGGHFRVNARGSMIVDFELRTGCSAALRFPPIPIEPSGSFAYRGRRTGVSMLLTGRFVSASEARVELRLRGGGCPRPPLALVARLS